MRKLHKSSTRSAMVVLIVPAITWLCCQALAQEDPPPCNEQIFETEERCDSEYDYKTWCSTRTQEECTERLGADGIGPEWYKECVAPSEPYNTDHCEGASEQCLQKYDCVWTGSECVAWSAQPYWWYSIRAISPDCIPQGS